MGKRHPITESPLRRSEIVTVRLDPRLKHLADIAARKQRRTLSGYIEWAVERSLSQVVLSEANGDNTTVEEAERLHRLWDIDEAERVAKLALHYPELLTYEEQLVWRLIRDCGYLWRGKFGGARGRWEWSIKPENLIWDRLREHWTTFKKVTANELPLSELPTWETHRDKKDDDDVPF